MEQSKLVKMFKALSNEQRLNILRLLYRLDGIDTCCDGVLKAFSRAAEELDICRSTVSHHFKELENAGLITCVRRGQATICKVNEEAVDGIRDFLGCGCGCEDGEPSET